MRETRQSGSEGGAGFIPAPTPISVIFAIDLCRFASWLFCRARAIADKSAPTSDPLGSAVLLPSPFSLLPLTTPAPSTATATAPLNPLSSALSLRAGVKPRRWLSENVTGTPDERT
jgi:hypothetical protein